jgi:hypothetical protein
MRAKRLDYVDQRGYRVHESCLPLRMQVDRSDKAARRIDTLIEQREGEGAIQEMLHWVEVMVGRSMVLVLIQKHQSRRCGSRSFADQIGLGQQHHLLRLVLSLRTTPPTSTSSPPPLVH